MADSFEQTLFLPRDMVDLKSLKKHEVFLTLKRDFYSLFSIQVVQASYVVEEWVDHALSISKEEESRRIAATKVQVIIEKKLKDSLFRLAEAKRGWKSTEATLLGAMK